MAQNKDVIALEFINLVKDLIKGELDKTDATILCRVVEANKDGTYNVTVVPDSSVVIKNVKNIGPNKLQQDDYVYVYKFNNQLNNAIILTAIGNVRSEDTSKTITIEGGSSGGGGGSQTVTINVVNGNMIITFTQNG